MVYSLLENHFCLKPRIIPFSLRRARVRTIQLPARRLLHNYLASLALSRNDSSRERFKSSLDLRDCLWFMRTLRYSFQAISIALLATESWPPVVARISI